MISIILWSVYDYFRVYGLGGKVYGCHFSLRLWFQNGH